MASYTNLPDNEAIAAKVVDADAALELRRAEMGLLGILLGGSKHKPGSVAFLTILLSFIMLAIVMFCMTKENPSQATSITLFGGLISASVGYLFGRSSAE